MSTEDTPPMGQIHVCSGFGHNTQQPFVEIAFAQPTTTLQLTSTEARDLALNILQAAEGAESDGFITTFFTREMELTQQQAAGLLFHFRKYRESLGGPAGPMPPSDKEED